jgi:hypothetical protein
MKISLNTFYSAMGQILKYNLEGLNPGNTSEYYYQRVQQEEEENSSVHAGKFNPSRLFFCFSGKKITKK